MKYKRVIMRGDLARIETVPFSQNALHPASRQEALELVNLWNRRVAEETVQEGNSTASVFYFFDECP